MRIPAGTLLDALMAKISAVPLAAADPAGEKLCEFVALYGSRSLGQALSDLIITKSRVTLIVPTGLTRLRDGFASHRVLARRLLHVDLLIADRAYYKAAQVAVIGGDKNLGVLAMAEQLEDALEGADLSEYGPAFFDDGAQQTVSDPADTDAPGREVWIQSLLIPAGTVESVCF